jgi:citrate synthase
MSVPNSTQNSPSEPAKFVKGLEGVVAGETVLSLVDGEESRLLYRGIPVGELTAQSTYEETVYFLWNGKFPTASELDQFEKALTAERLVSGDILNLIKSFPEKAQPMGVLRTMVSLLALFDPSADKTDPVNLHRIAARLTAVFPTLISAFHRFRQGKDPIAPDPGLSHSSNFLYMMNGKKPEKEMERALDAYLILLADHGFNASTFSARVTIATQSDMYSAVTSAIGTLKGDLHGSANQRAMEMILDIGTPDRAENYVRNLLAQKKKVMGFGHRIYKKEDPRATAFRGIANTLCERGGEKKWMEISNRVEKVMREEKGIPCNVDFFSSTVLYILGFPVDFFTTVFAASRIAGWTAHVIEQLADNRLIRPQAVYTGPENQHYLPMGQRK